MYDIYEYTVLHNNLFVAGYKHCVADAQVMPCYLFTTFRIMRIVCGTAVWKIGNKTFRVSEGDLVVVNNIETRQILWVEENLECEIFAFLPTAFGSENSCMRLFFNRSDDFRPVLDKDFMCYDGVNKMLDMLSDIFRKEACNERRVMACSLLTAVVSQIIWGIEQCTPGNLDAGDKDSRYTGQLLAKAIGYINENIGKEFNVIDLAKQMNLSRGHLDRIFRHYIGTTPSAFINRCRITNVIRLLDASGGNVLDCAMSSGFGSASGFYKTFRAICGMSPGEYLETRSETWHNNTYKTFL